MSGEEEGATEPKPSSGVSRSSGDDNFEHGEKTDDDRRQNMDETFAAVAQQTEQVVWTFMREYNKVRVERGNVDVPQRQVHHTATQTEEFLEFENVVPPTTRKIVIEEFAQVQPPSEEVRRLANYLRRIGEDMEQSYRPTVTLLVSRWLMILHRDHGSPLTFEAVWTAFRRIINAVLATGVTWGKVLLLLLFAYEIAVTLYVERVPQFVRNMISAFVTFLIESPVVKWIAEHGGWTAAVTALWMESMKSHLRSMAPYIAWVFGVGALALGALLFAKKK